MPALKANKTAIGIKLQSAEGTFDAPNSTTDLQPCSNLNLSIQGVTTQNPEYTGSVNMNGDEVSGKNVTISFNINMRPPGGADVPAANAYVPGRLLQGAKFTELRTTAPVPAAAEAATSPTTNSVTLNGAVATADLYKGMAIRLFGNGATLPKQMTAIRSYTAGKVATLVETLTAVPTGNYHIPKQLGYVRSIDESDPPFLSLKVWIAGKRYDLKDCTVSGLRMVLPVSTRDQAAIPMWEFTLTATIDATADEATPSIPALGPTPKWKDGDFSVANKYVGGSNLTVDLGLRVAFPPNPNKPDGSDAGQLVESKASLNMDRHAYLKADFDTLAMADAQAQHPVFAQWGYTAGNMVQIVIPDARFNYQNVALGGEFVTENGDMFIDVFARNVCVNFAYPA
ncbi:hypothetical protein [Parasphingorhabdus sp.]|uniref:hypothetical protein n=1 Tax=Parasphingorhabdus sp. TaxID=2709688 RepID=UPI003A9487F6